MHCPVPDQALKPAPEQEPELLEQINMATGAYEGVAAQRMREALAACAKSGKARAARGGAAGLDPAAAEAVRLLDRAADLYAQARNPTINLQRWVSTTLLACHWPATPTYTHAGAGTPCDATDKSGVATLRQAFVHVRAWALAMSTSASSCVHGVYFQHMRKQLQQPDAYE